jgi:hypothetical protein
MTFFVGFFWTLLVIVVANLAKRYKRSDGWWGLLAIFTGPLALMALLIAGPVHEDENDAETGF